MLLVFRQHRLASSATDGASATLPVLFERSEFTGECAELPTESCKLCAAVRRVAAPYKLHDNKIVRSSPSDDIRPTA